MVKFMPEKVGCTAVLLTVLAVVEVMVDHPGLVIILVAPERVIGLYIRV
jgi:hypothetical protein